MAHFRLPRLRLPHLRLSRLRPGRTHPGLRALPALLLLLAAASDTGDPVKVTPAALPQAALALPLHIGGRVSVAPGAGASRYRRQWPATYFEAEMRGDRAFFTLGPGEAALHLFVDGRRVRELIRPQAGSYAVQGLGPGRHRLRLQVASESQAGPTGFGGFYAARDAMAGAPRPRPRQIEFIGDSHTVGYGNRATTRACTADQVWATTDATRAFPARLAEQIGADYRVNAISGRGVVRNYDGGTADTLPAAYPYLLFDKARADDQAGWAPQLIVIALGTNDFSTALHPGEPWADRAALHAAFEAGYVRFVQDLRARNPGAVFILWATDAHKSEITRAVASVAGRLHALGETRLAFLPVTGLDFAACHAHPSLADHGRIARLLRAAIAARPGLWTHTGSNALPSARASP